MQKFSLFYSAPPFSARAPHFVWSGDETRDQKFSYTISDMNVFLPFTAFAFSCLEKNCALEYLFVSENTDCALLFDGLSL